MERDVENENAAMPGGARDRRGTETPTPGDVLVQSWQGAAGFTHVVATCTASP